MKRRWLTFLFVATLSCVGACILGPKQDDPVPSGEENPAIDGGGLFTDATASDTGPAYDTSARTDVLPPSPDVAAPADAPFDAPSDGEAGDVRDAFDASDAGDAAGDGDGDAGASDALDVVEGG